METYFQNKVIIITGASSGIGRELAVQSAAQGACLALAARNVKRLEETAELCRQFTDDVRIIQTDISVKDQCRELIDKTAGEYGRIDILINNAGMNMSAYFENENSLELIENNMKTNFLGGVYCTYFALPYIKKTRGTIAGIGSLSSKWGFPTKSGYSASKHAMAGFFDSLRMELRNDDVQITMVHPSFIATGTRAPGKGIMDTDICAKLILQAVKRRKRELIMTVPGKLGLFIKLFAPRLLDAVNAGMMKNTNLSSR